MLPKYQCFTRVVLYSHTHTIIFSPWNISHPFFPKCIKAQFICHFWIISFLTQLQPQHYHYPFSSTEPVRLFSTFLYGIIFQLVVFISFSLSLKPSYPFQDPAKKAPAVAPLSTQSQTQMLCAWRVVSLQSHTTRSSLPLTNLVFLNEWQPHRSPLRAIRYMLLI